MQSLTKYNKGNKYLLCAIDLFDKCVWVVPLKDKKGVSIVNVFQKIISEGRKPNKIWVNQGSEFYNNSFKDFLKINNTEMHSTYNQRKSVVTERFIRTLKNKIFKQMAAVSRNVYFEVLNDIVNKYNNTIHRAIKVGDHAGVSKYKNIFAKGYAPNWLEVVFVVSGIRNTVPWTYVVSDLNGEEITGSFYEKELQKTSQKNFKIKKVLKRKGDKLYFKWKRYHNRFNSWIDKKDLV